MSIRTPAPIASIAIDPDETGKLHAASAARNASDVCATVKSIAPLNGHALEIASGTGQHVVSFAIAMPDIHWHPTEVEEIRMASILAYSKDADLNNIAPPIRLNATQKGWGESVNPFDLITLANLLHLISSDEAATLISEASAALLPGGKFFLYGPFKRNGKLISQGDADFDTGLRASDPETGYKDDIWIKATAKENGLILDQAIEMPANNLALVFTKPV